MYLFGMLIPSQSNPNHSCTHQLSWPGGDFLSDVRFSNFVSFGNRTFDRPTAHARTPCDLGFCVARLAGIIQLLLIVHDGLQEVQCVLEKDASASL